MSFLNFNAKLIVSSNNFPTSIKSFSLNPLVVRAFVPILIPPGEIADLSPNTEFLFKEISTSSIFSQSCFQLYPYFLNLSIINDFQFH